MPYQKLRRNILSIFEEHVYFSILELGDSVVMFEYKLTSEYFKFTAVFKKEYFIWVEKSINI